MADRRNQQQEWVSVPDAARTAGVPPRSVYRWAKAKRLPTRRQDGVVFVDADAVRHLASARSATAVVSGSAGTPAMAGKVAQDGDGELASRLFEAFERGEAPADLVRSEKVRPDVALAAWRQWHDLREAGGRGQPSLGDRAKALEEGFGNLAAVVDALRRRCDGSATYQAVNALRDEVAALRKMLTAQCWCGETARPLLVCPRCGLHQVALG